jgi:histidine triad (HIT) family protein
MRRRAVVAFFPMEPATLGHTLLVPTTHIPDVWSLDYETAAVLAQAAVDVAHALRKALQPEGLNIIQSNGLAATQTVGHLHLHLLPRWTDDAVGDIWPSQHAWPDSAKDETLTRIRAALDEHP